jgi:hypothetical protein
MSNLHPVESSSTARFRSLSARRRATIAFDSGNPIAVSVVTAFGSDDGKLDDILRGNKGISGIHTR